MAYPPGVETCPVSIQAPITFGGTDAKVHLEVTPGARLIWAATGQTLADFIEQPADVTTGAATVELPTLQSGFQDEAGNAVLSWTYTARIRFEHGGEKRHVPLKAFTLPEGTPAVDLALIPSGPAIPIMTAPSLPVTSVNGEVGAVTIEGLDYALLARYPESLFVGTVTRDANGAPISAAVIWPDGTAGTYIGAASATFLGSIDAYTLTYGAVTYTQPAVIRDAGGNITSQPAITKEP